MRIKYLRVKEFWPTLCRDPVFFKYFPNVFYKRQPPRKYFWQVFFSLKKDDYDRLIEENILLFKQNNKIKNDRLILNEESLQIFKEFDESNELGLLSNIISKKTTGYKEGA